MINIAWSQFKLQLHNTLIVSGDRISPVLSCLLNETGIYASRDCWWLNHVTCGTYAKATDTYWIFNECQLLSFPLSRRVIYTEHEGTHNQRYPPIHIVSLNICSYNLWGWRDGSAVKGTGCSSRGPGFKSHHLHGHLQLFVTPTGDPTPAYQCTENKIKF